MPPSRRPETEPGRLSILAHAHDRNTGALPPRLQQVRQLPYVEQEHLLCAMLTRLQHATPTAYLAALTVIESLMQREVQQRTLETQRPGR